MNERTFVFSCFIEVKNEYGLDYPYTTNNFEYSVEANTEKEAVLKLREQNREVGSIVATKYAPNACTYSVKSFDYKLIKVTDNK